LNVTRKTVTLLPSPNPIHRGLPVLAPLIARLLDWLPNWFADHMMWGVLIVGVIIGTIAITLRLDHDI